VTDVVGPAVAGTWYPAREAALAALVDGLLAESDGVAAGGRPRALIAPHAGLAYSGRVAGRGFATLPCDVERVLLVGPTHFAGFVGGCVPEASAYRTPLGDVPIDGPSIDRLAACPAVRRDDRPFRPEHSLEAELPFLQRRLRPGFRIVPVLVGGWSEVASLTALAAALRPMLDARTIAVISSDFVHYGPRFGWVPFRDRIAARIRDVDDAALARVVAVDPAGFRKTIDETRATICGRASIDVLLRILDPPSRGTVVAYDTSGRMTGDFEHSVSYASVVFR
jgi:AmmeMemoRadiSam system protein B